MNETFGIIEKRTVTEALWLVDLGVPRQMLTEELAALIGQYAIAATPEEPNRNLDRAELRRREEIFDAQRRTKAADEEPLAEQVAEGSGTPSKDYRSETLDILLSLPPAGFERLAQRLLRESGFTQVVVTGQSGDGGIDGYGTLQINPLVSFKVLFQCKRYSKSVSPSQVRDFRGAMAGRADKGIIVTTGTFTTEARREATRDGVPPIELIDGEKLIDMLENLELGLRPVTTYELNHAFFTEFKDT